MDKMMNFGEYYISDFVEKQDPSNKKYSLDLYLDKTIGAVRLHPDNLAPRDKMWGKYWYRSGTNLTMRNELHSIVDEITNRVLLKDNDIWLDIACNDGTLLSYVPTNLKRMGIDPADDSFYNEAEKHGRIIQNYFSAETYFNTEDKKAKVITTIAMFYDLDDPYSFVQDITNVLDDDGIWVIQTSYTPLMLQQHAFDNICHEHVYYYSLTSLSKMFAMYDLEIVDAQINDTNGGSIRLYIKKSLMPINTFANATYRSVAKYRLDSLYAYEEKFDITNKQLWDSFTWSLGILKGLVVDNIRAFNKDGKTVGGYGASTKGNTLLQYFELTNKDITAIAERSPYKIGLKTVGTDIPIIGEDMMRAWPPNYLLILPWHFIHEFQQREINILNHGTKFIVPCPKFEIISNKGIEIPPYIFIGNY